MKVLNLASAEVLGRAIERGRSASEIMPCVTKDLGNGRWLVDIEHPSYPHGPSKPSLPPAEPPVVAPPGPGAELKKMLARLGISASANCSCNARARQMDEWGPDECLRRLDEISGWLSEEAAKRKLPYVAAIGKALVKMAVSRAKAKVLSQPQIRPAQGPVASADK